jgi:uncharacterized protein (TIGR03435 family)
MGFRFILLLSLITASAAAQDDAKSLTVGDPAPAIEVQSLLQAPPGSKASWETLRGKVVVLEFWATWCGPCVGAISHMNELTEAFKDRPVQFLAITDEDEATIQDFLARKPIRGWVGLNTNGSMSKSYGVEGIPHTVLVDKNGDIAGVTHPVVLEAKHIENVLNGKDSGLEEETEGESRPTIPAAKVAASEPPAFFQFVIRPSQGEEPGNSRGGMAGVGELGPMYETQVLGRTLKEFLPGAYGVHPDCLIVEGPLYDGKLDLLVRLPRASIKDMSQMSRSLLEATFELVARRETRDVDVYVLSLKTSPAPGFRPTVLPKSGYTSFAPGRVEAINATLDTLIHNWLEYVLKRPVVDETGLMGSFDAELKWDSDEKTPPDPTKIMEAVREQMGLELTLVKRSREVVIVSQRQP